MPLLSCDLSVQNSFVAAGVIHRNISGESIWLTDSTNNADAMLAGFEFSQSSILDPRQRLSACLGQVCYMAPEVVKKNYFFAADSYSFGVVLYCLLTGHLPFEGYSGKGAVLNMCCHDASDAGCTSQRPVISLG